MAQMPFFSRTRRIDNSTRASARRTAAVLVAGMALALVLGALSWRSPAAQAADPITPGPTPPSTVSGGSAGSAAAWTHCSAGSEIADSGGVAGVFVADANNFDAAIEADMERYLLSDPTICGFTVIIPWSAIDMGPTQTPQFRWDFLDNAVNQWTAGGTNGKIVNLSVWGTDERSTVAGTGVPATPAYVLSSTDIVNCPSDSPSVPPTPVYWEPGYQKPWQAFQAALVAHVNGNQNIGYIRFGLGAGDEDFPVDGFAQGFATDTGCWQAWKSAGLSAAVWRKLSTDQIDYEASLGSTHPIGISINGFPGAPDLPEQVAAEAAKNGMAIGMEGMTETLAQHPPLSAQCVADWCAPFATSEGKVPLLVQGYTQSCPSGGGPTGALPPLLSNAVGLDHAQVIELYPQEWLVADDMSWVVAASPSAKPPCTKSTYADYGAAYAQALAQTASEVGGAGNSLLPKPLKPACHGSTCS